MGARRDRKGWPRRSERCGGNQRLARRRWRRRIHELPLASHDAAAPRAEDDGLDAALLTVLRHLPDRQREVIALRVFLDLDIDTIALA